MFLDSSNNLVNIESGARDRRSGERGELVCEALPREKPQFQKGRKMFNLEKSNTNRVGTICSRGGRFPAESLITALVFLTLAPIAVRADLNGDGLPDAVFANHGQPNRLCLGNGAGGFSSCLNVSGDAFVSVGLALGDVDGDHDLDIVFSNEAQPNRLCTNNGGGTFACAHVSGDVFNTIGAVLGDVDGDNDLDIVFPTNGQPNRLCMNDGSGSFSCTNLSGDIFSTFGGALGDIDGDDDLDAVFANGGQPDRLCMNDGNGNFACTAVSGDSFISMELALGDIDGDDDLDAVFASWVDPNRICVNDGSGGFACADLSPEVLNTRDVTLSDVDGDNDLDVVLTNDPGPDHVCMNDGSGSFTCANINPDSFGAYEVVLGDLDGDNDLDAVFANANQINRACTNDGSGGFTCAPVSGDSFFTRGVALSSTLQTAPELSIATTIPGAESEAVDVALDFSANGSQIVASAFSVDYDETCLSFDDTDVSPADGIPDGLTLSIPGDFDVTAFHDLGDSDGEIDILISDLSPPFATLPDGPLATATFTATCSPSLGSTELATVAFSSAPTATYSNDQAQDVDGTETDGSVEIYPGPRGDCNSNGTLSVADIVGESLEIFDGDGTLWTDAGAGTFVGSPVGCDANADTTINAGDVSCTTLLIFGDTCSGGGSLTLTQGEPRLVIDGSTLLRRGESLWLPVRLQSRGQAISSLVFSLDVSPRLLIIDPSDRDRDGIPDAVRFPAGTPSMANIRFDSGDRDGELDVLISNLSGTALADGVVLEIQVEALRRTLIARGLQFSTAPEASFGSVGGKSISGQAVVVQRPKR